MVRRFAMVMVVLAFQGVGFARGGAELNPKAITIQLPAEIKWNKGRGSESAVLVGDPSKPGLYVELQ
jgi:hypothetical protein